MKTYLLNPEGRTTDGTPALCGNTAETGQIKHAYGQGTLFKEAKKEAGKEPEAGGGGKRWVGMRVNLGKGRRELRKLTGFSHFEIALTHLFPHKSTQVVDFPRMYDVRAFLRGVKFSFLSQTGLRTKVGRLRARILRKNYAFFRGFPRFSAQIRAVITRFLASQARRKLDAPSGLFACAKRGRIFTGGTFNHGWTRMNTDSEKTWNRT